MPNVTLKLITVQLCKEVKIEQRSQRLARQLASQQDDDEKTTCSGSGCVITGGRKKKTRRKRKRKRKKKTKRKRRARGRKTRKNILTIFKEGRGIKKTPRRSLLEKQVEEWCEESQSSATGNVLSIELLRYSDAPRP